MKKGAQPTTESWDCRPYHLGTTQEVCELQNYGTEDYYYFSVRGFVGGNFTLSWEWTTDDETAWKRVTVVSYAYDDIYSPSLGEPPSVHVEVYPHVGAQLSPSRASRIYFGGFGQTILMQDNKTADQDFRKKYFDYDGWGQLVKEWRPVFSPSYGYKRNGSDLTSLQFGFSYAYDRQGRIKRVTNPDGTFREIIYGGDASTLSVTTHDENGNKFVGVINKYGEVINKQSWTAAVLLEYAYVFDAAGRMTKATDPLGISNTYHYFADGNLKRVITQVSDWQYARTVGGKISQITRANGATITFGYDDHGRVISREENPGSQCGAGSYRKYTYTYDSGGSEFLGRLSKIHGTKHYMTFEYNAQGQVAKKTLYSKENRDSRYNKYVGYQLWNHYKYKIVPRGGRLVATIKPINADVDLYVKIGSQPTSTSYDCRPYYGGSNQETCIIDVRGLDTNVYVSVQGYQAGNYDLTITHDMVDEEAESVANSIMSSEAFYLATGEVLSESFSSGQHIDYKFDEVGQIYDITVDSARQDQLHISRSGYNGIGYHSDGSVRALDGILYNNISGSLKFNRSFSVSDYLGGYLNEIKTNFANQPQWEISYTYYPNGTLKTFYDDFRGLNHSFQYDQANRLIEAGGFYTLPDGNQNPSGVIGYQLDEAGSLKQVIHDNRTDTYTYDSSGHRLSSFSLGASSYDYDYDSDGQRCKTRTVKPIDFKYTAMGSLAYISEDRGPWGEFEYGAFRERWLATRNGSRTYYLDEMFEYEPDTGTYTLHVGVPGLITCSLITGRNTNTCTFNDHFHGAVLLNDTGDLVEKSEYMPYGDKRVLGGSDSLTFNFGAGRKEVVGNLHYFHSRYYDPTSRQWISPDPLRTVGGEDTFLGNTLQPYTFVGADPINEVDPFGIQEGGGTFGLTGGGIETVVLYALYLLRGQPPPEAISAALGAARSYFLVYGVPALSSGNPNSEIVNEIAYGLGRVLTGYSVHQSTKYILGAVNRLSANAVLSGRQSVMTALRIQGWGWGVTRASRIRPSAMALGRLLGPVAAAFSVGYSIGWTANHYLHLDEHLVHRWSLPSQYVHQTRMIMYKLKLDLAHRTRAEEQLARMRTERWQEAYEQAFRGKRASDIPQNDLPYCGAGLSGPCKPRDDGGWGKGGPPGGFLPGPRGGGGGDWTDIP